MAYITPIHADPIPATLADKLRRIIDMLDDPAFADLDPVQMQRAEKALGSLLESAEDEGDDLRRVLMSPPVMTQTARQLDAGMWDAAKWEGRL